MEDGSLVQEALHRMQQFRQNGGGSMGGWLQNTLVIDVFCLPDSKDQKCVNDILSNQDGRRDLLLSLAQLGARLNAYFQNNVRRWYPWHSGGDGPVFGVHVASLDETQNRNNSKSNHDDLPHLRATCRYGENIQDEWFAIAIMLQISKMESKNNIVVECWDIDDGQVLLIEGAEVLPSWVDEYGPDFCRHACWIQNEKVVLLQTHHPQDTKTMTLPPHPLTRKEALNIFMQPDQHNRIITTDKIQRAIQNRVRCFMEALQQNHYDGALPLISSSPGGVPSGFSESHLHRAAFVVPYAVACLMKQRPDLVQYAVLAYCHGNYNEANSTTSSTKNTSPFPDDTISLDFENLVWTTHTLSRTSYAMLRTIEREEQIKQKGKLRYKSIEVNRMKRLCRVEATSHLKHALRNGMCLTAGFEQILESTVPKKIQENGDERIKRYESGSEARILHYWTRIDKESGGNGQWLVDSWMAGPNSASYDLNNMLQCPVYNPEVVDLTTGNGSYYTCPLSHPRKPLRNQIQFEVKRAQNSSSKSSNGFRREDFEKPPLPQDADDEAWLELESLEAMDNVIEESSKTASFTPKKKSSNKSEPNDPEPLKDQLPTEEVKHESVESSFDHREVKSLDAMLDSFQTFVSTKSDIEGVQTPKENKDTTANPDNASVQVNPRVFLNLLHTTLKSSPEELQKSLEHEEPVEKSDPYFSKEDYDLMQEDDSSASSEDENYDEPDGDNFSMRAMMDAMDDEIRRTNVAMEMDSPDNEGAPGITDDDVARDAHVLSNLLESIDAGSGNAGPVRNILKGMGEEAP